MRAFASLRLLSLISCLMWVSSSHAQCEPFIRIDGEIVIANETVPRGLRLPLWLQAGQTLSVGTTVRSISVIEFTENGSALEYAGVLSITSSTPQAVPSGKVWKVESVVKMPMVGGGSNSLTYAMAGTNTFTVPSCAEFICIEIWGAGAGGQGGRTSSPGPALSGGGGGGGSYGQGCFDVTPNSSHAVTVGAGGIGSAGGGAPSNGGIGGNSSVGTLISAGGGNAGITGGGTGGSSSAAVNVNGFKGLAGSGVLGAPGGSGGFGGNGGAGGLGVGGAIGGSGINPGGGGAGGGISGTGNTGYTGGNGADGRVVISW